MISDFGCHILDYRFCISKSSLSLISNSGGLASAVEPRKDEKVKEKICRFCGNKHVLGKKFCKAPNHQCEKCGRKGHFGKVCRTGKKFIDPNKSTEAKAANLAEGSNWICGVTDSREPLEDSEFGLNSQEADFIQIV